MVKPALGMVKLVNYTVHKAHNKLIWLRNKRNVPHRCMVVKALCMAHKPLT
jgi:hypothetical protein